MTGAVSWREKRTQLYNALFSWGEFRREVGPPIFNRGVFWFRLSCMVLQGAYFIITEGHFLLVLGAFIAATAAYLGLVLVLTLPVANRVLIIANLLLIPAISIALWQETSISVLFFICEAIIVSVYAYRWGIMAYGLAAGLIYYLVSRYVANGSPYGIGVPTELVGTVLAFRSVLLFGLSCAVGSFGWLIRRQWGRLGRRTDESQQLLQRQRTLAQVATALTSELDHDRVVARVLRSAVEILNAAAGYVAVQGHSGRIRIVEVLNLPDDLRGREVALTALTLAGLPSGLSAPIKIDGRVEGTLAVFRTTENAFSSDEQAQFDSLGDLAGVAISNARLFAQRQRKESQLATLNAVGRALAETLDLNEAVEAVRVELAKALPVDAFFVATYDGALEEVSIVHLWDDGEVYPPTTFKLNDGITSQAIRSHQVVHIDLHQDDIDPPSMVWVGNTDRRTESIIVVPMLREDRVVGALSVQSYRHGAYDPDHDQLVQTVANSMAVALENQRLYEQMRRLSLQDWMTGLGNAHYFYQEMEREIARAERYRHPLSLIMIDSDLLKEINDRHGHASGDQHVVQVADIIRAETRQADLAIRYAGDEFLVILPETDALSAMVTAERIRQRVESSPLALTAGRFAVTVSVGVASYPEHGRTPDELFRSVDAALYEAKRTGKNRSSLCAKLLAGEGPMPLV